MVDSTDSQKTTRAFAAAPKKRPQSFDEVIWHRVPPHAYIPPVVSEDEAEEEFTAAHAEKYMPPGRQVKIVPKQRLAKPTTQTVKKPPVKKYAVKKRQEKPEAPKKSEADTGHQPKPEADPPKKSTEQPKVSAVPPVEPDAAAYLATLQNAPPDAKRETGVQDSETKTKPKSVPKPARKLELSGVLRRRTPKHRRTRTTRTTEASVAEAEPVHTPSYVTHLPAPSYGESEQRAAPEDAVASPDKTPPATPEQPDPKPGMSPMVDIEALAEQIEVDGVKLSDMFKEKRIDEAGLMRAVAAYRAGEDIKNIVTAEAARSSFDTDTDAPDAPPPKTRKKFRLKRMRSLHSGGFMPLMSRLGELVGSLGQNASKILTTGMEQLRDNPQARRMAGVVTIVGLYALIIFLLVAG